MTSMLDDEEIRQLVMTCIDEALKNVVKSGLVKLKDGHWVSVNEATRRIGDEIEARQAARRTKAEAKP